MQRILITKIIKLFIHPNSDVKIVLKLMLLSLDKKGKMGEVIKVIISELDLFLIDKVRELRGRYKPYMAQSKLSLRIGFAEGFVGKVETFKNGTRYNTRHVGLLANALNLNSYQELYPSKVLKNDLLEIEMELVKGNKRVKFNEADNVIKNYKILNTRVLTEDEVIEYNRSRITSNED